MKLLSLNIEGDKHLERVRMLLEAEHPECVCLQEMPEFMVHELQTQGYHVTFAPLTIRGNVGEPFPEGIGVATREQHKSDILHYHRPQPEPVPFVKERYHETMAKALVVARVAGSTIITTHFTWTEHGESPNQFQQDNMVQMLAHLDAEPPHVFVGDLNIPRFHNPLYETLVARYADTVPLRYTSSLDKTLHRAGSDPERAQLFTHFMVDHLLVKPPYHASDVRLVFGVSDHAAIVAEISKNN